jgi:hypothetical protein
MRESNDVSRHNIDSICAIFSVNCKAAQWHFNSTAELDALGLSIALDEYSRSYACLC